MEGESLMDWAERMNAAMKYIEDNLRGEIDYRELGRISFSSSYHFQRMFSCMAGMPLSEYIRKRRMSLAASEILRGAKVLDVALSFGYNSPTAFNRAFQSVHGVAPSALRQDGVNVKLFPPIAFTIMVKGAEEMNFRIEKRDAFKVVGVSQEIFHDIEKNHVIIPEMWDKLRAEGKLARLAQLIDAEPKGVLGVCRSNDDGPWNYVIGVACETEQDGFESFTVPAATWAIFSGSGSGVSIQQLESRIVSEWLPGSGYEYANVPDIEIYLDPGPDEIRYEVWIGIKEK